MTTRDAFGVVVRSTGLWIALWGIYSLGWSVITTVVVTGAHYTPSFYLAYGIGIIVVGLILLRWPDAVVRFAYPDRTPSRVG